MKFTSEDLMKVMGLQVGDEVEIIFPAHTETYIVCKDSSGCIILHEIDCDLEEDLGYLLDQEYEILLRPKRVGDLKCKGDYCNKCPLNFVCKNTKKIVVGETLYEILEYFYIADQEIHDLLKSRLDKEVE